MPREKLQITSINAGFAPTQDFGPDGSYQFGLAIDPDYSLTSSFYRKSAALVPVRYETFSGSPVTGAPNFLLTNPKSTDIYAYVKDPSAGAAELESLTLDTDAAIKAYYRMTAAAIVTDSSGQGHTLTNNNTVADGTGKFNGGADFSTTNTDKTLRILDNLDIDGGAVTISMWVKLKTEIAASSYGFCTLASNPTRTDYEIQYEYNSGSRRLRFVREAAGVVANEGTYTLTMGTSNFYHIALTYDGVTVKGYVNGTLVTSFASSGSGTNASIVSQFCLGARNQTGTSSLFSSVILDDVAVWNRALSQSEISSIYSNIGTFVMYSSALVNETTISAVADGTGNGGAYYNNYIYLATNSNVARYGPLDGTKAYTAGFWVTTLSKTALNNKTYPSIAEVTIPNHPMHVHGDNALYFGDTLNGQGIIHKIKTKKVTVEGDTDDGSAYNALDLPFGFFPTDIESYGTDLAIVSIQTTDSDANQGRAALFLWDTVADTFYAGPIYLPDPLGTALLNVNGQIFVWSGSSRQGCRLSKYLGGVQLSEVLIIEEACPPFSGAVAADGSRIYWGGFTVYPVASACVYSYGSKDGRLAQSLHIPIRTSSAGATPNATSLALYNQTGFARTKLVVGWKDASAQGIDKLSTSATYAAKWRSQPFNLGKKGRVANIRIPLGATLIANMSITPTLYFDDESSNLALTAITSTNFTGRHAQYKDIALKTANFENSFFLELAWAGTVECPVKFPIEIEVETFDNEK